MNEWTEDNFLERLTSATRSDHASGADMCPDANALCLVAEGSGGLWLTQAVKKHVEGCRNCAGIIRRLERSDAPELAAAGVGWGNAEKRLDNWVSDLVNDRKFSRSATDSINEVATARRWTWTSLISWQLPVAAVGVATLALLVMWVGRLRESTETASRPDVAITRPVQGPTANAPEIPSQQVTTTPPIPESSAAAKRAPAAEPSAAKKPSGAIQPKTTIARPESAVVIRGEHGINHSASGEERAATKQPITISPMGQQSSAAPNQTASTPNNPPEEIVLPAPGSLTAAPSHNPSGASLTQPSDASMTRSAPNSERGGTVAITPQNLPTTVRLEANAELWLVLTTVEAQPDGTFHFDASLMLPVKKGSSFALEKQTLIRGSGSGSGDKTQLSIQEIVIGGVSFALAGVTGAPNAHSPGSAWAHKFEAGQVLEAGLNSATIYRQAAGNVAKPQK